MKLYIHFCGYLGNKFKVFNKRCGCKKIKRTHISCSFYLFRPSGWRDN